MQIFIREYYDNVATGRVRTLEVEAGDSIENVKAKIEEVWGYPAISQTLYFGEILTEDGFSLSDYNVPKESTLDAYINSSFLPVELTSFIARANASIVTLCWTTATEVNNYGFDIERKSSASWTKVGFVEGHGTTNAPQSYTYSDNAAVGKVVYRLKQIDRDGKFEYSEVVAVTAVAAPTAFTLLQNYPNPFNPTTNISFTVPSNAHATLKILNILGQEVATLFNGEAQSGIFNQVQFNASGMASGMFFSRLEQNGKVQMSKMTLIK